MMQCPVSSVLLGDRIKCDMTRYLKRYALQPNKQQFTFALAGRSATKATSTKGK